MVRGIRRAPRRFLAAASLSSTSSRMRIMRSSGMSCPFEMNSLAVRPNSGAAFDMVAEELACRYMVETIFVYEFGALCAFAASRGSEYSYVHNNSYRVIFSYLWCVFATLPNKLPPGKVHSSSITYISFEVAHLPVEIKAVSYNEFRRNGERHISRERSRFSNFPACEAALRSVSTEGCVFSGPIPSWMLSARCPRYPSTITTSMPSISLGESHDFLHLTCGRRAFVA